jgi:hypothetical protein
MLRLQSKYYGLMIASFVAAAAQPAVAQLALLTDSFSRTVGEPPILGPGTPLVPDWGMNDNAAGGTISQTYEVSNQHVDATSTWRSGAFVDGSVGKLGYAHAEIQHDWATDPRVLASGKLTVEFDLIFSGGSGHFGWWFGASETVFEPNNGASGGGVPVTNANVDAAVFFRTGGGTGGSVTGGTIVNNTFAIDPPMSTVFPNQIRLEIETGDFQFGSLGSVSLYVNGSTSPVDINGAAEGAALNFDWDSEGSAFMGFSRNSSPAVVSIDNLKISTLEVPTLVGDYNFDGKVDAADYTVWRDGSPLADGSGNGTVGPEDYTLWANNYGATATSSAVTIPEPSALALIACGLLFVRRRSAA